MSLLASHLQDGNIEMSEFLSAAAGLKELQIASAFTQVVTDVQTAELRGMLHALYNLIRTERFTLRLRQIARRTENCGNTGKDLARTFRRRNVSC